jgi:hypothetical protein
MSSLQRKLDAKRAFQFTENDSNDGEEEEGPGCGAEVIELLDSSDSDEEQDEAGEDIRGATQVGGRRLRRRRPLVLEEPQDFQINLEKMRADNTITQGGNVAVLVCPGFPRHTVRSDSCLVDRS